MDGMLSAEEIDALLRMPLGSGPEEGKEIDALLDLTSETGEVKMPSKEEIDALMDELTGGGEVENTRMAYNPIERTEGVMHWLKDQIMAMYERGYKDGKADAENDIANNTDALDYQRGLDDAWEAIRTIRAMTIPKQMNIFGMDRKVDILNNLTASAAIAKIREWEEKKAESDEIKVGDEIVPLRNDKGDKGIVIGVFDDDDGETWYRCLWADGDCTVEYSENSGSGIKKTGRHFSQIAEVLKQMEADNE